MKNYYVYKHEFGYVVRMKMEILKLNRTLNVNFYFTMLAIRDWLFRVLTVQLDIIALQFLLYSYFPV